MLRKAPPQPVLLRSSRELRNGIDERFNLERLGEVELEPTARSGRRSSNLQAEIDPTGSGQARAATSRISACALSP